MELTASTHTHDEYRLMLTAFDVQEVVNLSMPVVRRMINRADFPKIRFGRAIRIPRDAFFKWLEQQVDIAG
ncbi:MAG: helix-turn-helix domain-containing protein [Bacillota bacterium]